MRVILKRMMMLIRMAEWTLATVLVPGFPSSRHSSNHDDSDDDLRGDDEYDAKWKCMDVLEVIGILSSCTTSILVSFSLTLDKQPNRQNIYIYLYMIWIYFSTINIIFWHEFLIFGYQYIMCVWTKSIHLSCGKQEKKTTRRKYVVVVLCPSHQNLNMKKLARDQIWVNCD